MLVEKEDDAFEEEADESPGDKSENREFEENFDS